MKIYGKALLLLVLVAVCSCSGLSVKGKEYKYERRAIGVTLKGDPKLNLYQGSPHTLVVCLYQLMDPNAFNQLADEKDGVQKLLECNRFDGSVAYFKRMVVQPDQEVKEALDRAEGAKYLGVVAGYYTSKERPIRLYLLPRTISGQIPVDKIPTKKPTSQDVVTALEKTAEEMPEFYHAAMGWDVTIYLGPQALQDKPEKKDAQGK